MAAKKINYEKFAPYFKDKKVTEVYVTDDGHVFFPSAKSFLLSYCRTKGVDYRVVTRAEVDKALSQAGKSEKEDNKKK